MQSRAKRLTESLKRKLRESRGRRFNEAGRWQVLEDAIGYIGDDISDLADDARKGNSSKFYNRLGRLDSSGRRLFEKWMDLVGDGSLADAVQNDLGADEGDDMYVIMQFIDENGY